MEEKKLIMAAIKESLEKKLGDGYTVTMQPVLKNNGVTLTGLLIRRGRETVVPNIYLEQYVEAYMCGVPLELVIEVILHTYEKFRESRYDVPDLEDFGWIRSRIVYQLINTSQNAGLLEDIPSIPFCDLSIVFRVMLESEYSQDMVSFLINDSHLGLWGVSAEDVWSLAQENTPRLLPANIDSLVDVISRLYPDALSGEEYRCLKDVYILSNDRRLNGCSCILYPRVLPDLADRAGRDLFIIPSSIHEALLIPAGELELEVMRGMARDVNTIEAEEVDILSDSIYFYSKDTRQITQI